MSKHHFHLPVGDWSDDGHNQCLWTLVSSNKSVHKVREVHFKTKELGIDIEKIAHRYEDDTISAEDLETLESLGFDCSTIMQYEHGHLNPEDMVLIWMFLLMKADPELRLDMVAEPATPMLPFYGFDDKGRHIGQIGYGTFSL